MFCRVGVAQCDYFYGCLRSFTRMGCNKSETLMMMVLERRWKGENKVLQIAVAVGSFKKQFALARAGKGSR